MEISISRLKPLVKVGYPNYFVSDCGKIFNRNKKQLSPDCSNAYQRVWLCKNGVRTRHFVHVLVAHHFCRKQQPGFIVNHKDHNKMNNHYSNLEWITQSENIIKYFKFKRKRKRITA